jgi:hypothetical protein
VPGNRILKAPGVSSHPAYSTGGSAPTGEDNGAAKAAPNIAEKNADFMKRKIEQADKDKKTAAEAKDKADKAKNCERARDYQQALDSGVRIGQVDQNGERIAMTDELRAKESQGNKQYLAACK